MTATGQLIPNLLNQVRKELAGFMYQVYLWDQHEETYKPQGTTAGKKTYSIATLPEPLASIPTGQSLFVQPEIAYVSIHGVDRVFGWIEISAGTQTPTYEQLVHFDATIWPERLNLVQAFINEELERKTKELDILSRIAQGINITVHVDDMLELLYAQTSQLFPVELFRVLLLDKESGKYSYPFYLEKDERIADMENTPILENDSIEAKVALSRKPLLSDRPAALFWEMNVAPIPNLANYMAVPLNSGADTVGCLAVGNFSSGRKYTPSQHGYLHSIADQAASAIVRSNLLHKMESRNKQLERLNQAAESLNSTLSTNLLVEITLRESIALVNARGGRLYLIDPASGQNQLKSELGEIGWPYSDAQYITTIPLEVNQQVVGELQISPTAGQTIGPAENQLLSAFANQAATAFQNAHLYTLTDENLAKRIEELSIMQQIDLELNRNIDLDNALNSTLRWAMKYSGTDTGLIGLWNDDQLINHQQSENVAEIDQAWLTNLYHQQQGNPNQVTFLNNGQVIENWLTEGSETQIVCMILRDGKSIGMLLLEGSKTNRANDEISAFLVRLLDHAVIAITNGLLFNQIKDANLAKSEFVSFVAHELKNPMTSIKGYSELMAAGAVGPLTDAQKNFLNTIHTNVERMRTIVEDLNDISKIEAGRLRLEPKPVKIAEIMEAVVNSTRRQIAEKNQTIELSLPSAEWEVLADKTRTEQVFINLVSNANKYTLEGGKIFVSAVLHSIPSPHIIVEVRDTGIGISPADEPKIFTKFFRSEDDRARKSTGAGLGLNITKNLVELQNGRIWFNSELNQGTSFYVSLPAIAPAA